MSDTDITISRDVSCCNQIGYDRAMGRWEPNPRARIERAAMELFQEGRRPPCRMPQHNVLRKQSWRVTLALVIHAALEVPCEEPFPLSGRSK